MPEYTYQDYVIMSIIATARPDVRLAAMALYEFLQQLDQAGGALHQTANPAAWIELLKHIPANHAASLLRRCGESHGRRRDRRKAATDEREREVIMSSQTGPAKNIYSLNSYFS